MRILNSLMTVVAVGIIGLTIAGGSFAHVGEDGEWGSGRPDGHGPIGVMADHTHAEGDYMLSYRYMHMFMEDFRDGSERVDSEDLAGNSMSDGRFGNAPDQMTMRMHMLGGMYALTDRFTVAGMATFLDNKMPMERDAGTMRSSGLGDMKLNGLYKFYHEDAVGILKAGLTVPTGSVTETDNPPPTASNRVGYPMQLGDDVWKARLGLVWFRQYENWSWGFKPVVETPLERNDEGWRPGPALDTSVWAARKLNDHWSSSLRLNYRNEGSITGEDDQIEQANSPVADADLSGSERLNLFVGVNSYNLFGQGHRFNLEVGTPVYEDLDLEMSQRYTVVAGWEW